MTKEQLLARLYLLKSELLMKKVENSKHKTQSTPSTEIPALKEFKKKNYEQDSAIQQIQLDLKLMRLSNENRETTQEIRNILNSISY